MSVSTNGQICYGILFAADFEFPWAEARHGDIAEWWRMVGKFTPRFQPFTVKGEFVEGVDERDPRIHAFFEEERAWDESHPLPVELVNVCSGDFPQYILATPSSFRKASRGYPEEFDPSDLVVEDQEEKALLKFCGTFGISVEMGPRWYLSSYWG